MEEEDEGSYVVLMMIINMRRVYIVRGHGRGREAGRCPSGEERERCGWYYLYHSQGGLVCAQSLANVDARKNFLLAYFL